MKEFPIEILNNQFAMQIIFATTVSYVVYIICFIVYNGGLWREDDMQINSVHIFLDCDPLLRPIVKTVLLSWMIYDKSFIKKWFLWSIDHTSIKWVIGFLFLAMMGIWIFQMGMWIYCSIRGTLYAIEGWKKNRRRKRVVFTKEEQKLFEFCVDKYRIYLEGELTKKLSLVEEIVKALAAEALFKSLLSLHILNREDIGEHDDLKNYHYDWLLKSYPEKHPAREYYAEFKGFRLPVPEAALKNYWFYVQESMKNYSFENMNKFIKSSTREYESSKGNTMNLESRT
ncbi:hypothetical protein M3Y14_32485 (plasmid) [Bacillus thuringiensis]|uniref:hypothetical protein n=1 Tax=Bacillus thuringiensis TaxID=1428 RepID=UPI0022242D12|nr:hypothetical protein [Bacillus thuringiensis]UYX55948.1 hypothetical protein M3Y14_32485 [Bacillus thuringiensis]